ncbi:MAG: CPBP family intramembrane metalloprotease [Chromatiaceae bacterium]
MKETGLFFLYLLACLLLGVLLAYPLMATGWVHEAPHRVMGRLTQAFALLGLWPFLEATGLNSRAALGYDATRARLLRAVWRGWLLGVAILAVLALTEVKLGVRVPETSSAGSVPGLLRKAAQALIGGLLVGLAEETFFRGALFSAIRRRGPVPSAVLWTALLYALLHFMKPGRLPDGAAFDWAASWRMFTEVFTGAFQWKDLDSHAGWVFVIQLTRYVTDGNPASPYGFLVGSYDGMIGWLAAGWIGALAVGFLFLGVLRRGPAQPQVRANEKDRGRTD